MNEKEKEEFAYKIVEQMDMENTIDSAVKGVLLYWKHNPNGLKEDMENNKDLIDGSGK